MASRKISFAVGEYYHLCNRGVDKRAIFIDEYDIDRFVQSMKEFNTVEPIGSIYENSFRNELVGGSASKLGLISGGKENRLVEFIAYCLNPNHYHFIITPLVEKGIEKFMHRLSTGYTMYFNEKEKRSGSLFQGRFKAEHIDSNEYLLHVSAYVNLNDRVHQLGGSASKLVEGRSSWGEYIEGDKYEDGFCNKDIILGQFKNIKDYQKFAESSLKEIVARKAMLKGIQNILLEDIEPLGGSASK